MAARNQANTVTALCRDAARGVWVRFTDPVRAVAAAVLPEVAPALAAVERAVEEEGLCAAGFVAYEAAPAFDPALAARAPSALPLLWFGLFGGHEESPALPAAAAGAQEEPAWAPSASPEEHARAVAAVRAEIREGNTYQVNYSYRLRARAPRDPWRYFLRLVEAQGPGHAAFLETGRWAVCSASPELFFRRDGERIESRPMKGTAARGRTLEEDRARAAALRASEKERAENTMIVDMVRNDLGRVSPPGSVAVEALCAVEKYPTLWQMTSTVTAKSAASLAELFSALFPPASVTGAPKASTMGIIARLEPAPRGLYTGAVGFLLPGRRAHFNVAIRTVVVDREENRAEYGVGGGITWDSSPAAELEECRTKARVLARPRPPFSLLETLRWEPGPGYALLERHLARLAASAEYFDIPLDPARARRALADAAVRFAKAGQRVRLLLDRSGALRVEAAPLAERRRGAPFRVALAVSPVDASDPTLFHKTTDRRLYEAALAARPGYDDVLLYNTAGEVTESTLANVALESGGILWTPPVECGLLPGTLRAEMVAEGSLVERRVTVEEARGASSLYLLNSVRGIWPATLCTDRS